MLKRLCARWKLLLTLFLLTPVILWAIAQWMVSRMLQPEALVARLEASLNCRAEVTSASANLWSLPATVQLEGLTLVRRVPAASLRAAVDARWVKAVPAKP